MKKTLYYLFLSAVFPVSWSAQAAWTLVEDFESYDENNPPTYPAASNGGDPTTAVEIFDVSDFEGIGGEKAAWFHYGQTTSFLGDLWHQIPLPQEIPIDGTGTIFFRVWQSDYDMNYHMISSKIAAGDLPDGAALWSNFSSVLRYRNATEPFQWDAHSGGYIATNPTFLPEILTWYNVWLVLDNSGYVDNAGTVTQPNGGWKVWVQGPSDSAPFQLAWGANAITTLQFRNQAKESIKAFVLSQNGDGGSLFPWLIDDIYFTMGEDTSNPLDGGSGSAWCDYPVDGNLVDTGDWMGYLYIAGESGWVYNYDLANWIYLPDCGSADGAWAYVIKP